MKVPALPADARLFVPHRGMMGFLETLDGIEPEAAATARTPGNPMTDPGPGGEAFLNPLALAEMAAQTCAAWNGYRNLISGGTVRNGFLAGIGRFDFRQPVPADSRITISVREETSLPPVTVVAARLTAGGVEVAAGDLKVWEQEEDPSAVHNPPAGPARTETHVAEREPGALTGEIGASGFDFHREGDGFVSGYRFDSGFTGFNGHFPGFPLVPGVMILRAAWLTAERGAERSLNLSAVKKIKFGRPVLPGDTVSMKVVFRSPSECSFELTGRAGKAASGLLEFAP